ncbi:MAG: hypothetical protein LBQ28_04315 [Prevotellaceae bacterium]|jgi:hypothetical protein|nr:hypothetical protein [Prevotellaceae bacterium]
MKNIEKKIRENTNEIFGNEPSDGHRERFAEKLSIMQKPKRIFLTPYLKYVAAAAIIVATLFVFKPETAENDNTAYENTRIVEVERYYAMRLDEEIDVTKELLKNIDKQYSSEILGDIQLMRIDKGNLPNALNDDRKAAIIVSVYSKKIESLKNIQNNLLAYSRK